MSSIVLIGSGNLATSLGASLHKAGHSIVQVYSRTAAHAQELSGLVGAQPIDSLSAITPNAHFYVLAVPDGAIVEVAAMLPPTLRGVVVHTSGSTGMEVLAPCCMHYGVIYPLQTFSKAHPISNFTSTPLFIEANTPDVAVRINNLAHSLSAKVELMNSAQRQSLHLSAVFACNFVNHLLGVAFELLRQQRVSAQHLRPLVEETVRKAFESGNPHEVQTGPAARGDSATLQKHLNLLANDPMKKYLYERISEQIREVKNEK